MKVTSNVAVLLCTWIVATTMTTNPLAADILLFDTFDVPSGSATRGDDAADPNDTHWYRADQETGTHPGLSVVGGELFVDVVSSATPFTGSFTTLNLGDVGAAIRFTGKVRQPTAAAGGIFLGLYNDAGTATSADNDSNSVDDTGYFLGLGTPPGAGLGASSIYKDSLGSGELFSGGSVLDSVTGGIDDDSLFHDFFLHVTRTSITEVRIDGGWSGATNSTTTITSTDSTSIITSFNAIAISFGLSSGTSDADYFVDDIRVESVPEPNAATALLALSLIMISMRRKQSV